MACEIMVRGRVVFVTWTEPEESDLNRILLEVSRAQLRCGEKVVYVTRVPAGSPPPSAAFNAALKAKMPRLLDHCSAFHAVMEGSGFMATLKRSAVAAAFLASGKRAVFHVHATTTAILSKVTAEIRGEVLDVLRDAAGRGMLTGT
jgi:hypothetical protein